MRNASVFKKLSASSESERRRSVIPFSAQYSVIQAARAARSLAWSNIDVYKRQIQHSSDEIEEYKVINDYNSFIMGIHNYYRMATAASPDIQQLAFEIKIAIKNRLQERVQQRKDQNIPTYAKRYAKSKEIRFIGKNIPVSYTHLDDRVSAVQPRGCREGI